MKQVDFNKKISFAPDQNNEKADDPFEDIEYTGDLKEDVGNELTALEEAFQARHARENKRMENVGDSEFWFAVCFKSREDKDQFIKELGMGKLGDKYIDGHLLAKLLGISLG